MQHLGVHRKKNRWRQWSFRVDPQRGVTIYFEHERVKKFNPEKASFKGFVGIVILGNTDEDAGQHLWVDKVVVDLTAEKD